jgi:phosphate starvation-inducible PhoH-like protein
MNKFNLPEEVSRRIFGVRDQERKLLEETLGVTISARGENIQIDGPESGEKTALRIISELDTLSRTGYAIKATDVMTALSLYREGYAGTLSDFMFNNKMKPGGLKQVTPKSLTQSGYIHQMTTKDLVFGIGPAGTGKTYLAVAMAVSLLKSGEVKRIILTRPAVEAGEHLGFLPGDLAEKVDPYLRPLYDALFDLLERERVLKYLEIGTIEIAPLAFMRGRTLNDAFIILDEGQNTTREQMKMFLTRIGYGSRAVITGDITQIDLEHGRKSGLVDALDILQQVDSLGFTFFTEKDVVRHPLVRKIVIAYDEYERAQSEPLPFKEPA